MRHDCHRHHRYYHRVVARTLPLASRLHQAPHPNLLIQISPPDLDKVSSGHVHLIAHGIPALHFHLLLLIEQKRYQQVYKYSEERFSQDGEGRLALRSQRRFTEDR